MELPSGEMAACWKVCAAKSVFKTLSSDVLAGGFCPAFRRFSTSCVVPVLSWAMERLATRNANGIASRAATRARRIIFTSSPAGLRTVIRARRESKELRARRLLRRNSAIESAQHWCPGGREMVNRRGFLSSFAGAAAVGTALNFGGELFAQLAQAPSQLPDRGLYDSNEEAYWTELRKQFLIPADEVYLNNGTVGSSPAPVLRAIF